MELAESASVTPRLAPVDSPPRDVDRTIVWLRGEHDVSTVPALSQSMARAIALDEGDLVVDLSGVEFMDAAVVGVIIRARDFLRLQSRSLALRSPSACATRILELCELENLLVTHQPAPATRARPTAGALGLRVVPVVPDEDAAVVADDPHDLQQRVRRGDVELLSLLRLDERTNAHRHSLARKAVSRLRLSRSSRSTRFSRPS